MKPVITFNPTVDEKWKKKWLKENYPECYDDFFPPEGSESASPKDDKPSIKKGRKGGT
jgi:hypothetical protein